MHFGSTKRIVIAYSIGIYIGINKCSRPPISPGPGEIPPPLLPLSGPVLGLEEQETYISIFKSQVFLPHPLTSYTSYIQLHIQQLYLYMYV